MLFRPIRTLILIGLAFLAGVMFERSKLTEKCAQIGGNAHAGLCIGGTDD